MKKFLLGTVGLLALEMGAPASAADMAVKARAAGSSGGSNYDWTGFYIGAMAAGSEPQIVGISLMWLA
jgi:outer membrane immunogenic protein